jgi:predicted RNase H-like nuclease (RuvC/YqgF family)
LTEDLADEKKQGLKTEDEFNKYKDKMSFQEKEYKEATMSLARIEIENDELKNDVRQMGFMVEDLEQKLDS